MKETIDFTISANLVNDLKRPGADIRKLLLLELNNNIQFIQSLLVGYHYAEAGQVCNLSIKAGSVIMNDDTGLRGNFVIDYETHYFMACSDNRYDTTNSMIIDFVVDVVKSMIFLEGEEILERMPDSY